MQELRLLFLAKHLYLVFFIGTKITLWYCIKSGKKFYIADPGKGIVKYILEEFKSHWISIKSDGEEKGIAMFLEPTPAFYSYKADGDKNEKEKEDNPRSKAPCKRDKSAVQTRQNRRTCESRAAVVSGTGTVRALSVLRNEFFCYKFFLLFVNLFLCIFFCPYCV